MAITNGLIELINIFMGYVLSFIVEFYFYIILFMLILTFAFNALKGFVRGFRG